jgi:hypothetical protein
MGLFTALLTLPLAPVRGAVWVADQVAQEAERQLYDEDRIRAELLQLEFEAEEGGLTPEEVAAREDDLIQRLAMSQSRRAAAERQPPAIDPFEDERNG